MQHLAGNPGSDCRITQIEGGLDPIQLSCRVPGILNKDGYDRDQYRLGRAQLRYRQQDDQKSAGERPCNAGQPNFEAAAEHREECIYYESGNVLCLPVSDRERQQA